MEILSAKWVVPVATPVIEDGSLVVSSGRIIDVGKRSAILENYPGVEERRYDGVLLPGLVNAHIHLELSHLHNIPPLAPGAVFTEWISELLKQRDNASTTRSEIIAAFSSVLSEQYADGIALLADTGNEVFPELTDGQTDGWPEIIRMVEFLGPHRPALSMAQERLEALENRYPACPHAPYSTAPALLLQIKERCRQYGHIFSIHTAESLAEVDFIREGRGCFRDFLEKRKSWDGTFAFAETGFPGTIFYFDHLGILDEHTLLVHAVHVSEGERQLAAARGAHICLCPGSNRFLNVGCAPVAELLAVGILPALGTDSRASNERIDLWHEMQLLAAAHPDIDHQLILAMATLGGAQALHRHDEYGSLAPGRKAQVLHVQSPALNICRGIEQVVRTLVIGGRPSEVSWVIAP